MMMTVPVPDAVEQQWAIRFQAQCTVCLGLPTILPIVELDRAGLFRWA